MSKTLEIKSSELEAALFYYNVQSQEELESLLYNNYNTILIVT